MDLEQGSGGTAPGAYANPATATGAPSMYASLRQVLFPYLDTSGLDGDGDLDAASTRMTACAERLEATLG